MKVSKWWGLGWPLAPVGIFFFFDRVCQIPEKALSPAPLSLILMAENVIVFVKVQQEAAVNGFLSYPFRYVNPPRTLRRNLQDFNRH